ncbi:hypothetical protein D3C71_1619420 [compost metagenome]
MPLIATANKSFQGGDLGAVPAWAQLDFGQRCMPAAPMRQEDFLDAIRPRQGIQHANLAGQTGQGGIEFGQGGGAHGNLLGGQGSFAKV